VIVFGIAIYVAHKSENDGVPPPRPGQPGTGSQPDTVTTAQAALNSLPAPSPLASPIPIDISQPTPQVSGKQTPYTNFGTIVFALFAALSLLVCLVRGIVPIYLVEAGLWAGLAWFWHKKNLVSPSVNLAVLLVAVFVAAGEGFMVGQQFNAERYTYLTEGRMQFRVNAHLGRTDRLGSDGWKPVSFDQPPEDIGSPQIVGVIWSMSKGVWENGMLNTPGKICFQMQNSSGYVLRDVAIHISLDPKPADDTSSEVSDLVNLKSDDGGLLDLGGGAKFCGDAPRVFPAGAKWSYEVISAKGWKQPG
jgi:hypothetical protein